MDSRIGVLPGARSSYLDHLIPLCALLDASVAITSEEVYEIALAYYAQVPLIYDPSLKSIQKSTHVLYVEPSRRPFNFFQCGEYTFQKEVKSLCGLHGNSDKFRDAFWAERFADEPVALLYGSQMRDLLQEKGVLERISKCIFTGNLRQEFYKEQRSFFDEQLPPFLKQKKRKRILYAPTWTAQDNSPWKSDYSTFFEVYPFLFDSLPDNYEMVVKLHPFLFILFGDEIRRIKECYQEKENLYFLDDFPLIYPLIQTCDLFIGDYSSVGYDFLSMDRPIFLFDHKDHALRKGATVIERNDYRHLYPLLERKDVLKSERQYLYTYAFGTPKSLKELREEIESVYG